MGNPARRVFNSLQEGCKVPKLASSKRATYPEPGAWVMNIPRGLPAIGPPEALPQHGKLTAEQVRHHVAHDGLGFCIFEYIDPTRIEDKRLALLWGKARVIMQQIVAELERACRVNKRRQSATRERSFIQVPKQPLDVGETLL